MIRHSALGGVAVALLMSTAAAAAPATAADGSWIATCVKQRAAEPGSHRSLVRYCRCMHGYIDGNEPFDSIMALERSYPPAHLECRRSSGRA